MSTLVNAGSCWQRALICPREKTRSFVPGFPVRKTYPGKCCCLGSEIHAVHQHGARWSRCTIRMRSPEFPSLKSTWSRSRLREVGGEKLKEPARRNEREQRHGTVRDREDVPSVNTQFAMFTGVLPDCKSQTSPRPPPGWPSIRMIQRLVEATTPVRPTLHARGVGTLRPESAGRGRVTAEGHVRYLRPEHIGADEAAAEGEGLEQPDFLTRVL
jgi:hypothetical protein